jgi:hypothetical protein
MDMSDYRTTVNDPDASPSERLAALRTLTAESDPAPKITGTGEINNHVHTIYSFSPYTPSMAALRAREAGLEAAGSVDHDSIAAAEEMIEACAILGMGGCAGFEVRVSFKIGPDGKPGKFRDKKINNPDSAGLAYMTVQGIPGQQISKVKTFLDPIRAERMKRTRKMADAAGELLKAAGLSAIDFDKDITAISQYKNGGEITERHLLAAVAGKLIDKFGKGKYLTEKLTDLFGLKVSAKLAANLSDPSNPHYLYDLLGLLKTDFLERIFIQPDEKECIPVQTVTKFAGSIGAIPAYAYLGDVGESPTGDKKAEKFEDDYIVELFDELVSFGFRAVTYMPPRNTAEQLLRVQGLCKERGLMEISGVDINSSRQSFNCPEVLKAEFRHLVDTTWALIAHERLSSADLNFGLFAADNPLAGLDLAKKLAVYAAAGKDLDLNNPGASAPAIIEKIKSGRYQL